MNKFTLLFLTIIGKYIYIFYKSIKEDIME